MLIHVYGKAHGLAIILTRRYHLLPLFLSVFLPVFAVVVRVRPRRDAQLKADAVANARASKLTGGGSKTTVTRSKRAKS